MVGVIPNLAMVEMSNTFTSNLWMEGGSRNWDADAEDDGIQIWWRLFNTDGFVVFFTSVPNDVIVDINIRFFAATEESGETKASDVPFFETDVLVAVGLFSDFFLDTSVLIPFQEYVPLIPPDVIISDAGASLVAELRLIQSDGSIFAARNGVTIAVSD